MDVSIVLINYNRPDLTEDCIKSIIQFTAEIKYEIIVVDNASTQGDISFIEKMDGPIKLIRSVSNLGFAKGNNLGLSIAQGDYILLLNNDTVLINEAIDLAHARIKKDGRIGVLTCHLEVPDGQPQYPAERFPALGRELRELFRVNKFLSKSDRKAYYLGAEFNHEEEVECDWVWGTFFMFPKHLLSKLPDQKLPDDLFMYGEDLLWCWSIKRLSYKIVYYHESRIMHIGGASSVETTNNQEHYYIKVLPNTYKAVVAMRGKYYAWLLFFIRAIHLFTLRTAENRQSGSNLMRFLFSNGH